MKLNLTKPLIVFDLETTGLDMVKDRIIQISYIKVYPDGTEVRKNQFVNPEKPIPEEVVALTGIIDAQNIFMKMERRNLAAAYKFYCGRKMEEDFEAHRADQDTEATYCVLKGELDRYAPGVQEEADRVLNNDMDELAEFSKRNDNVDFAGRIVWQELKDADGNVILDEKGNPRKHEVFNFGKYKGWDVAEILTKDPGYFTWVLGSDFTNNTKQVLTRIRLREFNKRMGK